MDKKNALQDISNILDELCDSEYEDGRDYQKENDIKLIEDAREEGYNDGYNKGERVGFDSGYNQAKEEVKSENQ